MQDDLVKRLRSFVEFIRSGGVAFSTSNAANDYQEAADRITALEAGLRKFVKLHDTGNVHFLDGGPDTGEWSADTDDFDSAIEEARSLLKEGKEQTGGDTSERRPNVRT